MANILIRCTQELRHLDLSPPPLHACLNVFSAFLHALSYLYLSMPLLVHPQSASLTATPSGWDLRFLLCLRILQTDYFNPRNLHKGPLEFPRTENILLWTMYLSYVVLQNSFKYTHTHTHTNSTFFGMFVVGFPDSLRRLFCCPDKTCCFPYVNCHLSKQTITFLFLILSLNKSLPSFSNQTDDTALWYPLSSMDTPGEVLGEGQNRVRAGLSNSSQVRSEPSLTA